MVFFRSIKNARFKRHIRKASGFSKNRQWRAAARHYRAALDLKPRLSWLWVQLGHALKESKALDEAASAYQAAVDLNRLDEETYYHLADVHRRLDQPSGVEAALRGAMAIQGELSDDAQQSSYILTNRAKADFAINGVTNDGLERLYKIVSASSSPDGLVQYGHMLKDIGRTKEAEEEYRKAISLSPHEADAYLHLGHALKLQRRMREAAYAYRVAFNLAKGRNTHVLQSAQTELKNVGIKADKLPALPKELLDQQANVWKELHRKSELLGLIGEWQKSDRPTPAAVADFAAELYVMAGDTAKARDLLQGLAENGTATETTYRLLAESCESVGDLDGARRWYREALAQGRAYGAAFEALVRLDAAEDIFVLSDLLGFGEITDAQSPQTFIAPTVRSAGITLPAAYAAGLRDSLVARGAELEAKGYGAQARLFAQDADLIKV